MTAILKRKKYWIIGGVSALVLALLAFFIWVIIPPTWHFPEGIDVHNTLDEMTEHAEFIAYGTVTEVEEPHYFSIIENNPYGWNMPAHVQPERILKGDPTNTTFAVAQGYHREGKEIYAAYPENITGFPLQTGDKVVIFMWEIDGGTEPGGFCVVRNGIVHINEWICGNFDK